MSVRFVGTVVEGTKRALSTRDPFVLGVHLVRLQVVNGDRVLAECAELRTAEDWIKPTPRQAKVIHRRAGGAPPRALAGDLGVSERTVRRDLSCFALANGARNAITAGALCEALGII